MDNNLISWGYFTDHNPFEPHCNAHPNNFVVLDLTKTDNTHRNLLSPVDFDMTFAFIDPESKHPTFVCTVEDIPTFGTHDRE
jgi:hypothetical protein